MSTNKWPLQVFVNNERDKELLQRKEKISTESKTIEQSHADLLKKKEELGW